MINYLDPEKYNKSSAGTHIASCENDLEVKESYTWFGWFMITWFGTSQNPYYIEFKCKKTGEIFQKMDTKEDIKYFMLYREE